MPLVDDRPAGGFIHGTLPAACAMCQTGTKMVLFLTGHCHYQCFYCPVSSERRMVDRVFANERELPPDDLEAIAAEANSMAAYGTGITGGDPMYRPQRAVQVVRFLKERFGARHHIHLYTNIVFDPKWIDALDEAGLDEIRFHPPPASWTRMDDDGRAPLIRHALTKKAPRPGRPSRGLSVGVEVPCPPGMEPALAALIDWCRGAGVGHVNLNELEFSPTNADALLERGYGARDETTMRVQGSRELALQIVQRYAGTGITVHFCTSPFKDAVQLKNRLRRQAERSALPYAEATDDGTLHRGLVLTARPVALQHRLRRQFGVASGRMAAGDGRLLIHPRALTPIADDLDEPAFLSEAYPTAKEIEVERVPLNEPARRLPAFRATAPTASRFP